MVDLFILLINLLSSILMLVVGLACLLAPLGTVEWVATLAQSFLPVQLYIRQDRQVSLLLLRVVGVIAILVSMLVAYFALADLFTILIG